MEDIMEIERMYTQAKMDETYLQDLCQDRDERVFNYALECGERIKRFKGKFAQAIMDIATNAREKYLQTNNPECFKEMLTNTENTYSSFYESALTYLKKLYSKW